MSNSFRSGVTLIEIATAMAVGLLVVLAAMTAVDAASKLIAAGKRQALEDELVAGAVRFLRNTPTADLNVYFSPPTLNFATTVLGTGYPAEWPQMTITRLAGGLSQGNNAETSVYQIAIDPVGTGQRTRLSLSVTSLQ